MIPANIMIGMHRFLMRVFILRGERAGRYGRLQHLTRSLDTEYLLCRCDPTFRLVEGILALKPFGGATLVFYFPPKSFLVGLYKGEITVGAFDT